MLRVKSVAKEINQTGNLVVIFDKLFRGTNVKDAFDASLAIITAFAKVRGSVFLVSTHRLGMLIIENEGIIGIIEKGVIST